MPGTGETAPGGTGDHAAGSALAAGPRMLRLLLLATVLLPLAVLCAGAAIAWSDQKAQAHAALGRLTDAAFENATKIMETNRLVLREMASIVAGRDADALRRAGPSLHAALAGLREGLPQIKNLLVFGADGRILAVAGDVPSRPDVTAADRDYFRAAAAHDGMAIGRRHISRLDGQPFFPVAVGWHDTTGRFAGVLVVAVQPGYFVGYFRRLAEDAAYGNGLVLTLRRSDEALLARYPAPPRDEVTAFATDAPALRRAIGRAPLEGAAFLPGDSVRPARLAAWRRLAVAPIMLSGEVPRAAIVHRWLLGMSAHLLFGVPATLALFGITLLALRRTQAAEAAAARALREVERREAAERVAREGRKMEALGKLTGGIAHDFNNLLAVIIGNAELAMNRPPDKARRLLEGVIAAAQRGERLTRQFLAFSRSRPAAPRLVDLAEAVPRVVEMVQPALGSNIQVETRLAAGVWPIRVDPGELEIALLNLAINSRDAMPRGGRVTVRALNVPATHLTRFGGGGLTGAHVALSVADTGTGMPRAVVERAFEPFFTTKEVGVGTGLGLSQVYGFARQSGGVATIDSTPGRGTVVTMLLPRAAEVAEPEPAAAPVDAGAVARGRRVLVIEDNEEVAAVTAALLRAEDCEVDMADRVAEARLLLESGRTYDLVLADIVMPGASGIDFAQEARVRWPQQRIVLMTGFSNRAAEVPAGVTLVSKPLRLVDFRRLLAETAAAPTGSRT